MAGAGSLGDDDDVTGAVGAEEGLGGRVCPDWTLM